MKLQTITLTAAASLLLSTAAYAQFPITVTDIGTQAPIPGALDISQLSTVGTTNIPGLNYYWDNGRQNPTNSGYLGQTFTTGSAAGGYYVQSLALKTDGNGGDTPTQKEDFTLAFYTLSGTGNTNATLVRTFTGSGQLAAEGDWIQFNFLSADTPLVLAANTTYAYGFGINSSGAESWERMAQATGTTVAGGQVCEIIDAGGKVTYSTSPDTYNATFDLGLGATAVPPAWSVNSMVQTNTNGVCMWALWGGGLNVDGSTTTGSDGLALLLTPFDYLTKDTILASMPTYEFLTNIVQGPNNNDAGSIFGGNEGTATSIVDQFIGVFIPPVTTNYTFYVCSDDYSTLYLSTDITAVHSKLVAEEVGWSNIDQWTASGGGSSLAQKRSDQFVAPGQISPQYPTGIPLIAGWKYFFEYDHQNGNGGFNDQVAWTYFGAPAPANSTGPDIFNANMGSNVIAYVQQPPSFVEFLQEPANVTAIVGGEADFSVNIQSDATPYIPAYQWQTNGVNVTNADGTAANGQNFTYIVGAGDTGTKVSCVVTYPTANDSNYVSAQGTLTVTNTGVTATGGLKREFWSGQTSLSALTSGNLPAPDYASVVTNGVGPSSTGISDYVERYSGWFIPPTTGKYVFFVSSDDNSDLFISTDNTPDSKYLIAQETSWATNYEWLTGGGESVNATNVSPATPPNQLSQKRSDEFIPAGETNAPYAGGIELTAGQQYYIEADHDQGGGGDDFSMTFALLSNVSTITNGSPSAFAGANIAFAAPNSTNLQIVSGPFSASVFEGDNATFQVTVATDSQIRPTYEWLVNGTNMGTGLYTNLTSTFTLPSTYSAENNDQIQVVVSIPFTTLVQTSTVASLTVQQAATVQGFLKLQYYPNQPSSAVIAQAETGKIGLPEYTSTLNVFETPVNDGISDYLQIISGFFIPPETGLYVFNLCSDDQCDLWLSTDDTAANLKWIAQETQWSNDYQWLSSAGGSILAQKESDTFIPTGQTVPPYTNGIALSQGSNYFIEVFHYQGGGGDNAGVYFWTKDGNYPIADGALPDFAPTNIAMLAPAATITVTTNPASTSVISGSTATFTAGGTSTSQISVDDVTNVFVSFQWYFGGAAVPGAIGSSFTTPLLASNATGTQVYCALSAIGAGVADTTAATVTVIQDTNPPHIVSAYYILDSGGPSEGTNYYVDVIFDKIMGTNSVLNPANYTIAGNTVSGVTLLTNGAGATTYMTAILLLNNPIHGSSFTLNLSGVSDFSGVAVANPEITGGVDPLTSVDIGEIGIQSDGTTAFYGNSTWVVDASGNDIWANQDGFRYIYTTLTNNFDVVVQVPDIQPADQWSKAGLMVREALDPSDGGAREFSVVTTANTNSPRPLDGSGPQNTISYQIRGTAECNSTNSTSLGFVAEPNTGGIVPSYPDQWLRITRQITDVTNDVMTGYESQDGGNTWTELCVFTPDAITNSYCAPGSLLTQAPFPSIVYVGMCLTAHIAANATSYTTTATFQNFNTAYVYTAPATQPILTNTVVTPTSITMAWGPAGGGLYSSPVLTTNSSSWTLVTTNNPATVPISTTGPSMFFEVIQ